MSRRPHVIFVDDEPLILGGIRRMLRTHRDRWDMSFADSGEAALTLLRAAPCDVVVSDYRMPGMDGGRLLELVRGEFPATARVILSGQTDEVNLSGVVVLAHEFLTKPSTPDQLVATVERLISVRDKPARRELWVAESLPSPPHTMIDLVEALNADDASAQSVAEVIARDPAATAKVLQLVNSSAYTSGRTVSSVSQAVVLLGLDMVRGLVLIHDLIHTFDPAGELPAEWIEEITQHSVETSRLARLLAAGRDWESQAFAAGLLHEAGQLALASSRPALFRAVLAAWHESGDVTLAALETAAFGISHTEAGEDVLRVWGLPDPVIAAVTAHAAYTSCAATISVAAGPEAAALDAADPTHAAGLGVGAVGGFHAAGVGAAVTDMSSAGGVVPAVSDVSSAVALAHAVTEAEVGPACGPCGAGDGAGAGFDDELIAAADREAVSRWRREWSRSRR